MKLITETVQDINILTETKDGQKHYFIEGVFMQAEAKNRNGRLYPMPVMEKELNRYTNEYVKTNRAMGELGHPEGPTVNLERVSHLIKDLHLEKKDVYGKAKILDTPYGKIVRNLIDEGVKLGVSSRGMGSLKEEDGVNVVQEDFMLAAVDVVADPSAPNAFVNGIMEGREWIWEGGVLKPVDVENYKRIIKKTPLKNLEEQAMLLFKDFISKL